jgi:hypothetical protein
MATYFERNAFKHPKPADFFAVANEVSGQDLTWYFDQVYRGSQTFDYGVDRLRSDRIGDRFHTMVTARRYGDGVFPVDLQVTYEDGGQSHWPWDGRDRWRLFQADGAARAVSVEVDPRRVLLLDVNRTNNSAALTPDGARAARKWSLAWLVAAGSAADLWVLSSNAAAALRDGCGGSRRHPPCSPHVRADTGDLAPLSFALRDMLEAHLGASSAAGAAAAPTTNGGRSLPRRRRHSATFVPSIIGFGAVLLNLSNPLDNVPLLTTIAGVTGAWLVLWSFLSGGILDRFARRPTRARVLRRVRSPLPRHRASRSHRPCRLRVALRMAAPAPVHNGHSRLTHELPVERNGLRHPRRVPMRCSWRTHRGQPRGGYARIRSWSRIATAARRAAGRRAIRAAQPGRRGLPLPD